MVLEVRIAFTLERKMVISRGHEEAHGWILILCFLFKCWLYDIYKFRKKSSRSDIVYILLPMYAIL